jgi:type IV pilus assembly protein PilC
LLLDALYIVKDSFKRKIVSNTIVQLIEKVQGGESLSEAMKEYPAMFDEFYVSVITVGEAVGSMANTFDDLSNYYKIRLGIQKKAKTASIYPIVTLSVLTLMLLAASKFFLPQFKDLFKSAGVPLPGITKFIFSLSDSIPNIMLAVFITIVLHLILYNTVAAYNKYLRIGIGWVMANAPIAKKYTQIMSLYNFSSTMQIMLKNGISLLDSLELGTHVIQNYIYKVQIASLKSCVIDGLSFAESAGYLKRLDQFTTSMIRIGEESGNLANAFQNINEYQQEALKEYTDTMVEMMQPIMMLLLAAIAIPVILGIYLPLMSMSSGNGVKL